MEKFLFHHTAVNFSLFCKNRKNTKICKAVIKANGGFIDKNNTVVYFLIFERSPTLKNKSY